MVNAIWRKEKGIKSGDKACNDVLIATVTERQPALAPSTPVFYGVLGRWGIKSLIIIRGSAVHRRNVFMVLPRG